MTLINRVDKTVQEVREVDMKKLREFLGLDEHEELKELYAMDGGVECIHAKFNPTCEKVRIVIEIDHDRKKW